MKFHIFLFLLKYTGFFSLDTFDEMQASFLFSVPLQSSNISHFRPLWLSFPTTGPVATAHLG